MSHRANRVASFRHKSGGRYDTALLPAGHIRARDRIAVWNWVAKAPTAGAICFGCQSGFSNKIRPAAFLTVAPAGKSSSDNIAVAGLCVSCWRKTPDQIEALALACLRKQLDPRGKWLDGVQP